MKLSVTVIGGGVLAVSVGVLLRTLGIRSRLVAAERADQILLSSVSPNLASAFPAASILPHSTSIDGFEQNLVDSLRVFKTLHTHIPSLVRSQWHYEVFEESAPDAPYLPFLERVEEIGSEESVACPLQRLESVPVVGWRFRSLFVEAPQYFRMLFRLFQSLGGAVERRMLRGPEDVLDLPGDFIIVCAGMGSPRVLGLSQSKYFEQGHLVHLPVGLENLPTKPAAYNYTPLAGVHPNSSGGSMDVYAYPRTRTLVLGGSRLPGVEDPLGNIRVEQYRGRTCTVENYQGKPCDVPEAIISLNKIFLAQLLGVNIEGAPMTALIGRRYMGLGKGSGIIEMHDTLGGRPLLACYGLGGAGVTMSWGLARRCLLHIADTIADVAPMINALPVTELATSIGRRACSLL